MFEKMKNLEENLKQLQIKISNQSIVIWKKV